MVSPAKASRSPHTSASTMEKMDPIISLSKFRVLNDTVDDESGEVKESDEDAKTEVVEKAFDLVDDSFHMRSGVNVDGGKDDQFVFDNV